MKITFLTSISDDRCAYGPGQVGEWDDEDALRLIAAGFAEPYQEGSTETASVDASESSDIKPAKKRKA